ncbi:hypothetical protein DGG96_02250 [Legionella qingyii]|uniref:YARHG domain-containing protein n=1 Tax=Legionella qingyii TaxID=2184757 RepID=A0A317U7H9_9GAMM|nr:YARHG domain-containing protein [Legionella qingyii]PWY56492.1 hypothetical protein DGG96_06940 [Legionella qingyii]PWY57151.1 hypothetical protein DGG96_02250 [Legionella qingyii]RUR25009.1 YARHG domain-containing protein [Legionella qingyii]RUR28719.1 YARHG domain-containing protein [Legionella qingyii]
MNLLNRYSSKKTKRLSLFFILFFSKSLFANDTALGGNGSLPIPVSQPDIKMVKEVIIITGKKLNTSEWDGSWHYSCDFQFKNTLNKKIEVAMGFPFPVNNGMSAIALPQGQKTSEGKALVYNFQVRVDNTSVASHKEKIAPNEDKGLYYNDAYVWDTTFPALATVSIHHDYETGATYDVMGFHWVSYVLKTGALWHDNTIGHTQLEVIPNTPTRLCSEVDPKSEYLRPKPAGIKIMGNGKDRKYVWNLSHFQPKVDLQLCLYTPKSYVRHTMIYPVLNSDNPINSLSKLSAKELQILRNTVYAQYGRRFNSPDLQNYFKKQWWYEPNPDYSDNMLTKEDKKLLSLINQLNKQ